MPIPLDTLGYENRKLTLKTDSIVHSIIYDKDLKKAVGVRVIDAHTNVTTEYFAKVIFLNALP